MSWTHLIDLDKNSVAVHSLNSENKAVSEKFDGFKNGYKLNCTATGSPFNSWK